MAECKREVRDRKTECVNGEEWIKYKSTVFIEFTGPSEIKDNLFKRGPIQTSFSVYIYESNKQSAQNIIRW